MWRPLVDHLEEQLALGRPAIVEVDAFYLPDTAGTSYHTEHVKTSIAVQRSIALAAARLLSQRRLLRAGRHDFAGLFRLASSADRASAAVRGGREARGRRSARRAGARCRIARTAALHLARRPRDNPFRRYARALRPTSNGWQASRCGIFIAMPSRRSGSAARRSSSAARTSAGSRDTASAARTIASACDVIATTAKALQFKTARVVNARRPSIRRRCSTRWRRRGTRR